ncbi:hypothetical protein [Streptomyces globisporus]|uniref:hypothetical protein n=1 Tax=Streptomyces globisporus TaxID=1908 RepID=UPI0013A6E525|nr:hypothetical protein [Streptomyces globisporus]
MCVRCRAASSRALDLRRVAAVLRDAGVDVAQVQGAPGRASGRPEQGLVVDRQGQSVPGLGHIAAGLVEIRPDDGVRLARPAGVHPEPVQLAVAERGAQELAGEVRDALTVLLALSAPVGQLLGDRDHESAGEGAYDGDRAFPHQT